VKDAKGLFAMTLLCIKSFFFVILTCISLFLCTFATNWDEKPLIIVFNDTQNAYQNNAGCVAGYLQQHSGDGAIGTKRL
jgi:hypothetical protein